jgi:mRNA-degrading endonuclease toxin of MazEF toxin-antitoxin module
MCEQVKSLDFRARGLKKIGSAPKAVLEDVLAILDASLY